jgi:hypothetical protein
MANKKQKTQKEMYTELLALPNLTEEQKEFLKGRIAALDKKSTSKKQTESQKRNTELAEAVYAYMEEDKMYTITDLMKEVPAFQEVDPLSNQFATNIVKILKDDGRVTRVVDKGRAKFIKVVAIEAEPIE